MVTVFSLQVLVGSYKYEVCRIFFDLKIASDQLTNLIENLEDALITWSDGEFGYCNLNGYNIIEDIQKGSLSVLKSKNKYYDSSN